MEVKLLMYAFGDDPNPSPESVAVLEDIVTEYINEMVNIHTTTLWMRLTEQCLEAARISAPRHKLKVDDFKIALRNDPKKLGRVEELLYLQKVIAEARKQFDTE